MGLPWLEVCFMVVEVGKGHLQSSEHTSNADI